MTPLNLPAYIRDYHDRIRVVPNPAPIEYRRDYPVREQEGPPSSREPQPSPKGANKAAYEDGPSCSQERDCLGVPIPVDYVKENRRGGRCLACTHGREGKTGSPKAVLFAWLKPKTDLVLGILYLLCVFAGLYLYFARNAPISPR